MVLLIDSRYVSDLLADRIEGDEFSWSPDIGYRNGDSSFYLQFAFSLVSAEEYSDRNSLCGLDRDRRSWNNACRDYFLA